MLNSKFQFQYGTIEREMQISRVLTQGNFNSSMVRLRERELINIKEILYYFNSSMVRLRDRLRLITVMGMIISIPVWYDWESGAGAGAFCVDAFQFQYGTIESAFLLLACRSISDFNSSMVRLRAHASVPPLPAHKFQFQYGTIESPSFASGWGVAINFNSSMVRLRDHA